jgi:glutamate synthase (NADPH/NADH) small chain
MYKKTSSQEEGCEQRWNILTKELRGSAASHVVSLKAVEVDWSEPDPTGRRIMRERPGTEFELNVDLVILALGFTGPSDSPLLSDLGVALTERGAVKTDGHHATSVPGVYCAGDIELGPSLVVHAIRTGREAAIDIHSALTDRRSYADSGSTIVR